MCQTCERRRDTEMTADHDFDRIAAADPINDPKHQYATEAEWQARLLETTYSEQEWNEWAYPA